MADEPRWLGDKAKGRRADYERVRPRPAAPTFADVATPRDEVVRPRLPTFRTMQGSWEGQQAMPDGSAWPANAAIPGVG